MAWIWGFGGSSLATADMSMIFTGVSYGIVGGAFQGVAAAHRDGVQQGLIATSGLFPSSHWGYCWKSFPDEQTVWFAVAMKTNNLPAFPNLIRFTYEGTDQLTIRGLPNGELQALRGGESGTVVASSDAGVIALNSWFHLTGKVTISNGSGTVVLYLNGSSSPIVNATGLDTQNHASAALLDSVYFGVVYAPSVQVYLCDLAIWNEDDTGDGWTGWMGDVSARSSLPIAMGTYADWDRGGTDSGSDYGQVDEPTPNGDTDYLIADTIGEATTFTYDTMNDLGITGRQVVGVQTIQVAKKPTSGTASLGMRVRSGGADFDQTGQAISTNYAAYSHFVGKDPDTDALWTEAAVDAAELGPLKTA